MANFKLGLFYSQEDGLRKSRRCFKRVVQSDGNECYAEACYQLALSYQQGGWLLRNLNKANYYLMQSFNKGFALAQILYYEHQIEDYCGQVGTHILNHNIDQAIAGLENHLQPQNYLGSVDSKRALELWIRLTACKGLYQAEYKNTRSRIVKYLEEFKQQHKDACNVFSEFDFLLGLASDQRITDKFFLELIKYKFKNFLNPEAIQQNFATCTDDAVILCYEAAHKQLGVDHQLRPYLNALSYNAIIPKTDESDDCKPVAEVPLVISA